MRIRQARLDLALTASSGSLLAIRLRRRSDRIFRAPRLIAQPPGQGIHRAAIRLGRPMIPIRSTIPRIPSTNVVQRERDRGEQQQQINQRAGRQMDSVVKQPGEQEDYSDCNEHGSFQSLRKRRVGFRHSSPSPLEKFGNFGGPGPSVGRNSPSSRNITTS
jgi:hypothetical protein